MAPYLDFGVILVAELALTVEGEFVVVVELELVVAVEPAVVDDPDALVEVVERQLRARRGSERFRLCSAPFMPCLTVSVGWIPRCLEFHGLLGTPEFLARN
jgi:hypothetical protein